jgi:hypothetical protein
MNLYLQNPRLRYDNYLPTKNILFEHTMRILPFHPHISLGPKIHIHTSYSSQSFVPSSLLLLRHPTLQLLLGPLPQFSGQLCVFCAGGLDFGFFADGLVEGAAFDGVAGGADGPLKGVSWGDGL